ncbi:hypothetical protein IWX90DRAFT_490299 [Phyllosticta citrichinensis]|uniref:Uncharacterized protein n=1 Tax=Phyllosticta citrichinensis TaxID=1130410 RepID=A0ABR1XGB6_9PEZI
MSPFQVPYMASPAHHASGNKRIRLFPKYILYSGSLVTLVLLAIAFWACGAREPFALPVSAGIWVENHTKEKTFILTLIGSVLTYVTLFLLDKLLHLMVKQKIQTSTSLATIEGWSKLSYHKLFLDVKSPYLALFSLAMWITASSLTSAYTTLLTPKPIIQSVALAGSEIHVQTDQFAEWYKENKDKENNDDLMTCGWWTYTNPNANLGWSVFYPSCAWAVDQVAFMTSGMVSALSTSLLKDTNNTYVTYTRVADSVFDGSTGGVLPIGRLGILAFMDDLDYAPISDDHASLSYTLLSDYYASLSYNYTLEQQGFSVKISCKDTGNESPISRSPADPTRVSNGYDNQTMSLYTFTYDTTDCANPLSESDSFVTPENASVGVYICMGDEIAAQKWTVYLRPFGTYTDVFPNMACTIDPYLTTNNVTYMADGAMIKVDSVRPLEGSSSQVPPEIIDSIRHALIDPYTSTSNAFLDAVISVSETAGSLTVNASNILPIFEDALRGVFEYQGTMARIRYRALGAHALTRTSIPGSFSAWRLGWSGSPTSIATLLPLLTFVLAAAAWYCLEGLRADNRHATAWDPLNPVCLVAAGAAGGAAGRLAQLHGKGAADEKDKLVKRYQAQAQKPSLSSVTDGHL